MAAPSPVPSDQFQAGNFLDDVAADDLVYFLLNVGDGDSQLVVLPAEHDGRRRALVIDVGSRRKLPALVDSLIEAGLLTRRDDLFSAVVGTHPHEDHIAGMPEFLDRFGDLVREYWEPGYYHPSPSYMETMRALEENPAIQHSQPTSGFTRFVGPARIVVLSPTISLRNHFDSYGVTINNASIALKIEFPASRVEQRGSDRRYLRIRRTQGLVLGADAQILSWGQVMNDFPSLEPSNSPVAKQLRMALGADAPRTGVQGSAPRVQARGESRAGRVDQAGAQPHFVRGRRGPLPLPAHRRSGVRPRSAGSDRDHRGDAPARPRVGDSLHRLHRLGRADPRLDRNRDLADRAEAASVALR
jgi:Metallo-beta-lactamase superfamily